MGRGGRGGRAGRGGNGGRGASASSSRGVDSVDTNSHEVDGPFETRGRKRKSRTELKMPPRSGKIVLEPGEDNQFRYAKYQTKKAYTYPAQLGVILKQEYPGLVEEKDEEGNIISVRAATCWEDYYLCPDDSGVTHADRVKREFWHLFEVNENDQVRANIVLEEYAVERVPDMMYSARIDAVKEYYRKQGEIIDEALARPRILKHEQYMEGKVWWCSEEAWPYLCTWWCSDNYKGKRKRGQDARLGSDDVAQNRGGSRNFTETQQLLEHTYGPEKASDLKTYQVMKSGMKNIDLTTGDSGPISSQKVHKLLAAYEEAASVAHPDDWQERPFDPTILYDINAGLPHGRLPMGSGVVSKAAVKSAARLNNMKPSKSSSYRAVLCENQELRRKTEHMERESEKLQRIQALHRQVILTLLEKNNLTPPPELLDEVVVDPTSSSHMSPLSREKIGVTLGSRGSNQHGEVAANQQEHGEVAANQQEHGDVQDNQQEQDDVQANQQELADVQVPKQPTAGP